MQVGYGLDKEQVKVQLGKTVNDAFRTPWGKDAVSQNEPDKLQIKIDMTPELRAFIEAFETATITAGSSTSIWSRVARPKIFLSYLVLFSDLSKRTSTVRRRPRRLLAFFLSALLPTVSVSYRV